MILLLQSHASALMLLLLLVLVLRAAAAPPTSPTLPIAPVADLDRIDPLRTHSLHFSPRTHTKPSYQERRTPSPLGTAWNPRTALLHQYLREGGILDPPLPLSLLSTIVISVYGSLPDVLSAPPG